MKHLDGRRVALLGMALLAGQAVWAAGALPVPAAGVYLGIWANPALAPNQEAAIEIREGPAPSGINRPFALHLHYYGWTDLSKLLDSAGVFQPDSALQGDLSHGRAPVISWVCDSSIANSNHVIAGGSASEDAVITATAKALAQFPGPVLLRWFWEFNVLGNNQSCRGDSGGTPTQQVYNDFIGAWQHIWGLFQKAGAANVVFLWNPGHYNADGNADDPHGFYPGGDYVDWIGIDTYQRTTTATFDDDFGLFYSDFSKSQYANKPLMVGENGAQNFVQNSSELQWTYLQGLLSDVQANRYPLLKAYDYFDALGTAGSWVLDDNAGLGNGGLAAFAALAASKLFSPAAPAQKTVIQSISVCSPTGAGGSGNCPAGTFDTHQIVLAPDGSGNAINTYGVGGASDEHSSAFSPGTLGSNSDYLFFAASGTGLNPDIGMTVLSGGAGPGKNGQWTFDFASADNYGSYAAGYGTVFLAPTTQNRCPTVADGNPAHQDQTYDLNYAAPGSVVQDPTSAAGSLLMVYEGTNTCFANAGGVNQSTAAYITLGLATSVDYGRNWPSYRGTPSFNFVPLPNANKTQGPNAPAGALGKSVCMGTDCTATPPAGYGRYAILSPPSSLASVMATGTALTDNLGDAEPSAFVDDASSGSAPYLYAVYGYVSSTQHNDLALSRAQLNGGTAPLNFGKWNGQSFSSPGAGGVETPMLPVGSSQNCGAAGQSRHSGSIYYVETTGQYLLVFNCDSASGDPLTHAAGPGSAWFYSTSYDLSNPAQWTPPQEIPGSWGAWDSSGGCISYKGWYPSLMSLAARPGHLSTSGYVFYLWGCEGGSGDTSAPKRQFSSRAFTITTGPAPPVLTAGTLANGATYISGGLVPGSWAQVKGTSLSNTTRIWAAGDFAGLGNNLPTNLSGVQVMMNNLPAAVYYISPTQVSFQAPTGVTGTVSVQVIDNGMASNTVTAAAAANSPGIFPVILNGTNYPAGVFFADGLYVGDPSNGPAFRNARPGDIIELYATGLAPAPGGMLPGDLTVSGVTVTIGSVAAPASFAGLVAVGEFQINFTVPQQFANLTAGNYPLSIQVNGVSSPVTINSSPPGQLVLPIQH